MELVKDIYFNTDKLVENTKVKVSYTGKFYQGNDNKVFLHYGYGQNWNNLNEVEMAKTDLGYQTELDLIGNDTINFCFKNQNNEWDNNSGKNYIFNIEPIPAQTKIVEQTPIFNEIVENTIINNENNVDAVINENKIELNNPVQKAVEFDKDATQKLTYNLGLATPTVENKITTTAITVQPTGFNLWTQKIKNTVFKFFSYVPKLVSKNYKRNVTEEK